MFLNAIGQGVMPFGLITQGLQKATEVADVALLKLYPPDTTAGHTTILISHGKSILPPTRSRFLMVVSRCRREA